jgi:hypothetical protein
MQQADRLTEVQGHVRVRRRLPSVPPGLLLQLVNPVGRSMRLRVHQVCQPSLIAPSEVPPWPGQPFTGRRIRERVDPPENVRFDVANHAEVRASFAKPTPRCLAACARIDVVFARRLLRLLGRTHEVVLKVEPRLHSDDDAHRTDYSKLLAVII